MNISRLNKVTIFAILFTVFTPTIANAVVAGTSPQALFKQNCIPTYSTTTQQYEPYKTWVTRLTAESKTFCFSVKSTRKASYDYAASYAKANKIVSAKTEFDKRFEECTGPDSTFSILNFASIKRAATCWTKTAFVPTSSVLTSKVKDFQTTLNGNAPFYYVTEATITMKSIFTQMNKKVGCASSEALNFSIPNIGTTDIDINIPCQPPTAMRGIRSLLAASVYIGYILSVFLIVMKVYKQR